MAAIVLWPRHTDPAARPYAPRKLHVELGMAQVRNDPPVRKLFGEKRAYLRTQVLRGFRQRQRGKINVAE
jgi:hypothetical protein